MNSKRLPDMNFARRLFDALDMHWAGPEKGMARPGYSAQESEAIGLVGKEAHALGMAAYQDLAGNTYFIYAGQDSTKPIFLMGSHLDAVENGGRYDGPAGVVAALTAVKHLHDLGTRAPHDICVVVWRNEEGPWFNQFALGSKLATGALKNDILDRQRLNKGPTLETCMAEIGLDVVSLRNAIATGQMLLPIEQIGRAVEVHIEQGSELELQDRSLGIVTGIRGNIRYPKMISFFGEAGHSGTVPQAQRKDAVRAAALFVTLASQKLDQLIAVGEDLVFTWPETSTPGAFASKIPAHCSVRPETRSLHNATLGKAQTIYEECAREAAHKTGTMVSEEDLASVAYLRPATMSSLLQNIFAQTAAVENIPVMHLPSGAGHDAGVLAECGIPAGMLFIRHGNKGVSHRPDELMTRHAKDDPFSTTGDFCNAVRVLSRVAHEKIDAASTTGICFADALLAKGGQKLQL